MTSESHLHEREICKHLFFFQVFFFSINYEENINSDKVRSMSSLFMFNTKMEQWLREIAIDAKFPSINHYKVS